MKFLALVIAVALNLAWIWPLSAVQAGSVVLKNETGRPIGAVYLASAGANDWSGWGGAGLCLEPGRKWRLELPSSSPDQGLRDLRVIFDDGQDRTYFGLDLELYTYVVLGEAEAELFEWDPSGRPAE